jgi:hypothetical protein
LAIVETKYAIVIPSAVFSAGAAASAAGASAAAGAAAGASSVVGAGVLWQANMEHTMSIARTITTNFFILCLPPSCFYVQPDTAIRPNPKGWMPRYTLFDAGCFVFLFDVFLTCQIVDFDFVEQRVNCVLTFVITFVGVIVSNVLTFVNTFFKYYLWAFFVFLQDDADWNALLNY